MSQFNPLGPSSMFLSGIGQGANIASDAQRMALALRQQQEQERWRQQQAAQDAQRFGLQQQQFGLDSRRFDADQAQRAASAGVMSNLYGSMGGYADPSGGASVPMQPDQFMAADPVTQRLALEAQIDAQMKAENAQKDAEIERGIMLNSDFTESQKRAIILARRMKAPASLMDRMLGPQGAMPQAPVDPAMIQGMVPNIPPETLQAAQYFVNQGMPVGQAIAEARRATAALNPQTKPDNRSQVAELEVRKGLLTNERESLRFELESADMGADTSAQEARLAQVEDELRQIGQVEPYIKHGLTPPGQPTPTRGQPISEITDDSQVTPEAVDAAIDMLGPDADPERIKMVARAAQAMMRGG